MKDPKEILRLLKLTLEKNYPNYEKTVEEFRQLSWAEKREMGESFSLDEHVRGLILAMLSNQRPWGQIATRLGEIEEIFFRFDANELEKVEYKELLQKVRNIKCGNRNIKNQLRDLPENIRTLRRIQKDCGSVDKFVTSKPAEEIAKTLSDTKNQYKLKQIGFTLAMEYLRNAGIRGMKPDLHLLRICGSKRLEIFPEGTTPEKATKVFNEFCKKCEENPVYVDNLFWLFGAKDYANICSAKPKCHLCELQKLCNYPKK